MISFDQDSKNGEQTWKAVHRCDLVGHPCAVGIVGVWAAQDVHIEKRNGREAPG